MAYTCLEDPVQIGEPFRPSMRLSSGEDRTGRCVISLDKIRKDLIFWGRQLSDLVQGPARMLTQDGQQVLADLVCRIAVIGQVKAGKSSFVNALVGRPNLLPADVNPWTTVVTKLHFSCSNAPDGVAAAFKFFDHDEWTMIAHGGGRVRELTERLVPGFTPATLSRHLEAMRLRAKSRLGKEFQKLLGTTHEFPELDHATLERYVCAGPDDVATKSGGGPGQYSDITKTADLYFKSNEFGFPTVMIDTPGTNDPFLVRDEITRRSLDGADFHIVVLTAQQPLSTADVTLLRMLRGLHKERIVVFVNRIDQLTNLPDDAQTVAERVRDGLQAEFPGIDIPIVVGSALWANDSLLIDRIDVPSTLSSCFSDYARHLTGCEVCATTAGPKIPTDEIARILMVCSGIPEVKERLHQAILDSHASRAIAHIAANFCALARVGEISTQDEIARVEHLMRTMDCPMESTQLEARKLEEETVHIQQLSADLNQTILELDRQLGTLLRTECDALSGALHEIVETFSREERLRLDRVMSEGKPARTWRCDTAAVRRLIETEYVNRFREAEGKILDPEHIVVVHLRRSVAQGLPDRFQDREMALQPPPITPLSLSILGTALVFDLDYPWWLAWWTGRLSKEDRLSALVKMIRREFLPVVDDLVCAARNRLTEQVAATLLNAKVICSGVVDTLRTQNEWHAAKLQELATGDAAGGNPIGEHRRNLAELHEWLQKWETVGKSLADIRDRCHQLLGNSPVQSGGLV